jgi:predicted GIY-YIG superfamily endonuclease
VKRLLWYENQQRIEDAIQRKKNLKGWTRKWKPALIETTTSERRGLYDEVLVEFGFARPVF